MWSAANILLLERFVSVHYNINSSIFYLNLQIQGLWKTKNQNMADLCKVAKELKDKFTWFEINHVERVYVVEHFLFVLQYKMICQMLVS